MGLLSMVRKTSAMLLLPYPAEGGGMTELHSCRGLFSRCVPAAILILSPSLSLPFLLSRQKKRERGGRERWLPVRWGTLTALGGKEGEIAFVIRRVCILENKKIY